MDRNTIVYTTAHGEKYHKDKYCLYIVGKNLFPVSLEEAKIQEKEPCKGCTGESYNQFYKKWYNNKNKQIKENISHNKNKNKKENYFDKNNYIDDIILNDSSQSNLNSFINYRSKIINNNNNKSKIFNSIDRYNNISEEEKKESSDDDIDFNKNKYSTKNKKINTNNKNSDLYFSSDSSIDNEKIIFKNNNKDDNLNIQKYNNNKNGKEIPKKIQDLIEKDKNNRNNIIKYNNKAYFENNENESKINDKINNDKNNISINNNKSNSINLLNINIPNNKNPLYLNNIQLLFNYFSINCNKRDKICLNSENNLMDYLEETNKNAQILLIDSELLNGGMDINGINDKKINIKDSAQKGCYKYELEITPLNEKNNIHAKISVGFEIEYINISDMNLIIDENMINDENKDLKIGAICENDEIKKNLIIFRKTGVLYILININIGKMFIIGKEKLEKLEKKQECNDIFFVKNFEPININFLKNIKPIFQFNKTNLNIFDIKINGKNIK